MIESRIPVGRSLLISALALGVTLPLFGQVEVTETAPAVATKPLKLTGAEKELVERAIHAMGGKAIQSIKTLKTTAEMTGPMGTMSVESYWSKTGHMLSKQIVPGMGEMTFGTDGKIAWTINPMTGYRLLDESQLEQVAGPAAMHMRLLKLNETIQDDFDSVKLGEDTEFVNTPSRQLLFTKVDDGEREEGAMMFDAKSGLPMGIRTETNSGAGGPSVLQFKGWHEVKGVQFFQEVAMESGGMNMEIRYKEIEVNNVDMSVFEMPEEIQRLMSAPTADPNAPKTKKSLEDFPDMQRQMIEGMLNGIQSVNDPAQLKMVLGQMESQKAQMPNEMKEAFQYVIEQVQAKIKKLGG